MPVLLQHGQPVVADTLVAMYNPQLATWRTSPAANEIERHTLSWLAGKFGLPATTMARAFNAMGTNLHHWYQEAQDNSARLLVSYERFYAVTDSARDASSAASASTR